MMKKAYFIKSLVLLFLLGAFYSCVKDEQFSNRQTAKEGIIRTLQVGEMNKDQRILEALEYINETFGDSLQNPYTVFEAGGIYNSLGDYHSYTFFIYKHGAEDNHIRNLLLSWDGGFCL